MSWEFINNHKTEKQLEKEVKKTIEVADTSTPEVTTPPIRENIRVTKVELKVIDTKTGIIYKDMWQASMRTGVEALRIAAQCKYFKGKGRFPVGTWL